MKNGLCLAGGGVKGAAHIGAIKALEEENIKFQYIGGTSSGSIVACLYACGFTSDEMYEIFKKYCKKIKYVDLENAIKLILGLIFTGKVTITGLNSGKQIEKLINKVCNKKEIYNINDIKMPLVIPSVDLCNGEVVCFTSCRHRNEISDSTILVNDVDIGRAVRASCSFPVVFSPCDYKNIKLIDGGVRENVPWRELKYLGAKNIVNIVFDEEDIEFAAEHDLVHTALWGKAENTLPKIAAKGIPIAFDYADRLDHPLVEETLPYVTYGFYSYHEGRDAKIEEFLKDKVSRGMKIAVVTFGEDGSLAWDGERFYVGGIEKAEVVNTVGAGDSFIAGFLYGILNGKSIDECLKKGAEVAASVVQVFEPWVE